MSDLLYYSICSLLIIGVLGGIALMSRVSHSSKGNILSSVCVSMAILITLYKYNLLNDWAIWACIIAGLATGLYGARKVKMISMPQTVALLNGLGGAASALVASISMLETQQTDVFSSLTGGIALGVGTITLTGSLVAGAKLHGILPQKPVVWKRHSLVLSTTLFFTIISTFAMAFMAPVRSVLPAIVVIGLTVSGFFGFAFTIRVGGADMPITISLLNSLSGVAGAIAGMVISDPLLISVGGIVGASGLLLTQIMCKAMNRPLKDILLGKSTVNAKVSPGNNPDIAARNEICAGNEIAARNETEKAANTNPENTKAGTQNQDPAAILSAAKKVIIVPGYGMALAQAQETVRELAVKLEENGAEVLFAIHPVAGRMPGHMNVLLCEVGIPYDKLYEMDDINLQFADCDAVVVIGANDVVNPAANTAEGTPIYGMPVLEVDKARHVIICNFDLKPGYSGVENPLYHKAEGVTLLLGDAKDTVGKLLAGI